MTVRINKQKINLREKLAETEEKVNFDQVVRGLGEYGGNVGIGTTSPLTKMFIETSAGDYSFGQGINEGLTINDPIQSSLNLYHGGEGSALSRIVGIKTSSGNTDLAFITQNTFLSGQSGRQEWMRIKNTGNVGIGTTNPFARLDIELPTNTTLTTGLFVRNPSSHTGNGGSNIASFHGPTDYVMQIKSNGNVGINTTNPAQKLDVYGNIAVSGSTVHTSDDRVKHNEQPIIGALETLSKITPKKYIKTIEMYDANHDFELDADGNPVDSNGEPVEHRIEAGVIAQQVLTVDELAFAVSPEGVDEDGAVTRPHGLDYNSLFTYAIAAIQEQQQLINDLKSRIETLEQQ